MSIQFGVWAFDNSLPEPEFLERVGRLLAPYSPDSASLYQTAGLRILYRPFHTTAEAEAEKQPARVPSGAVITWDGRLDNRLELASELAELVPADAPDASIVAAAYQRWGTALFKRLIGDWAISIWDPDDKVVILAKDVIGTRHLYYAVQHGLITWSSILDPLVLLGGHRWQLSEEYLAGCLSLFPAANCTPYHGIHSVPPASFVLLRSSGQAVGKYWEWDPQKEVCYRTDSEYEEHFREVFAQSVARRLRSNGPVLAELSGGMDSASIVSVADKAIESEGIATQLDTFSYYDDSDASWNERPFFTKVEERRGREGFHMALHAEDAFQMDADPDSLRVTPGSYAANWNDKTRARAAAPQHRVVLSGIGGDEVLGGVATPLPELRDLLAYGKLRLLAHRLKLWSLDKRLPWLYLLRSAVGGFLPLALRKTAAHRAPPPWLDPGFVKRNHACLTGYERSLRFPEPRPSFQENLATLYDLQRQLAITALSCHPPREKRYPYLDRDLLEFVYAVPREQIVRPGQRRSLMRRALRGIVPDEILFRKRKAVMSQGAVTVVSAGWRRLQEGSKTLVLASHGILRSDLFRFALEDALRGRDVPLIPLIRTIAVECWLRVLQRHDVVSGIASSAAGTEREVSKTAAVGFLGKAFSAEK